MADRTKITPPVTDLERLKGEEALDFQAIYEEAQLRKMSFLSEIEYIDAPSKKEYWKPFFGSYIDSGILKNIWIIPANSLNYGCIRSTDNGKSWVHYAIPSYYFDGVFGNYEGDTPTFVMGGDIMKYSLDGGENWTSATIETNTHQASWHVENLTFCEDIFVASGRTDGVRGYNLIKSIDGGLNWTYCDPLSDWTQNPSYDYLASGNGIFLVYGTKYITAAPFIAISSGGINWTYYNLKDSGKNLPGVANGVDPLITGLVFGDGVFIISYSKGLASSPDGENWTQIHAPEIPEFPEGFEYIENLWFGGRNLNYCEDGIFLMTINTLSYAALLYLGVDLQFQGNQTLVFFTLNEDKDEINLYQPTSVLKIPAGGSGDGDWKIAYGNQTIIGTNRKIGADVIPNIFRSLQYIEK